MSNITRRQFNTSATSALALGVVGAAGIPSATALDSPDAYVGFLSATELAAALARKDMSSVELTRYFIDRIERYDKVLNAIVVRDFERALEAAAASDKELAAGRSRGALHGLPMTIKESFDIAGLPTTWGFPPWKDNIATADSDVVRRLKAAGAHFMGKTNVPLMLGDFQTYNEIYGATGNPWDPARTPGGSSGGSAAALAAGFTGLDAGSDIGGSIRNPAHYCGVYGHKPTWGVVSSIGHAPPGARTEPDLAVVGPMARSAVDLAVAMRIVTGPNALDAPGVKIELPMPRMQSLKGLRVAVWANDPFAPVDAEIAARCSDVGEALARLGAKVSATARPQIDPGQSFFVYSNLLAAVTEAGVPDDEYERRRKAAASYPDDDMSPEAVRARASVLDHRAWLRFDGARAAIRSQWARFFEDWDVLLCPIMATPAFTRDQSPLEVRTIQVDGVAQPYFQQVFWAGLAILAYLPATVFPTGPSKAGLPIGLQAIGPAYEDRTTIEFAKLVTDELGGFKPPPGYTG
jgi:amidase